MIYKRKAGMVLNAKYGHIWPLNLFKSGFVVMLSDSSYAYTPNRKDAELISQGVEK